MLISKCIYFNQCWYMLNCCKHSKQTIAIQSCSEKEIRKVGKKEQNEAINFIQSWQAAARRQLINWFSCHTLHEQHTISNFQPFVCYEIQHNLDKKPNCNIMVNSQMQCSHASNWNTSAHKLWWVHTNFDAVCQLVAARKKDWEENTNWTNRLPLQDSTLAVVN